MNDPALHHIDCWIFDLDNTLYHPRANLFAEIDQRMGDFIAGLLNVSPAEAKAIQKQFFHSHGTTLRGLMDEHGIEPAAFLHYVHDVDMSVLAPDAALATALARLPGRKFVFTNADTGYARRVLDRLGLGRSFDGVHCIIGAGHQPKPRQSAYDSLVRAHAIDPRRAIFFEDMAVNLVPAKAMGMTTVWVANDSPWNGRETTDPAHIDYEIADISPWLTALTEKAAA